MIKRPERYVHVGTMVAWPETDAGVLGHIVIYGCNDCGALTNDRPLHDTVPHLTRHMPAPLKHCIHCGMLKTPANANDGCLLSPVARTHGSAWHQWTNLPPYLAPSVPPRPPPLLRWCYQCGINRDYVTEKRRCQVTPDGDHIWTQSKPDPDPDPLIHAALWRRGTWGPVCDFSLGWAVPLIDLNRHYYSYHLITCTACTAKIPPPPPPVPAHLEFL